MQRYLQYDVLAEKDLVHFDAWASTFGETVTSLELAPEGVKCQGEWNTILRKHIRQFNKNSVTNGL